MATFVLLVAVHHPQVRGVGQPGATVAPALREQLAPPVRGVGPRQMRSRRTGLAYPAPAPAPTGHAWTSPAAGAYPAKINLRLNV